MVGACPFQAGEDTVPTYHQGLGEDKEFHLDYCFGSARLVAQATINVLDDEKWRRRSDRYPVVVDGSEGRYQATNVSGYLSKANA